MTTMRWFGAAVTAVVLGASAAPAQEFPKPGPEHDVLKRMVGNWDTTMKAGGMKFKGTVVYKMELGGLWLSASLEMDFAGGAKFSGKGLDGYDPAKKKYVSVWVDNMSNSPLLMEGTYDPAKKTLTMSGTGPGIEGSSTKYKSVSEMPDDDTINFTMYMGDGKEPAFTVTYLRKK